LLPGVARIGDLRRRAGSPKGERAGPATRLGPGRPGPETNAMNPSLRLVSERFAQIRDRAVQVFERDENFRDLCEEYEACTGTIARLESGGQSPQGLRNEYAALLLRLEHELLRYLEEHPARGAD